MRYIGYGVTSICDHPECNTVIDRGMGYACCDGLAHNGKCEGYFCLAHLENYLYFDELGDLNENELDALGLDVDDLPEEEDSPIYKCNHGIHEGKESVEWLSFILNDDSWAKWREINPLYVTHYEDLIAKNAGSKVFVMVQKLKEPMTD